MKIEVGKTYRVTDGSMKGEIVKIVDVGRQHDPVCYRYVLADSGKNYGAWFDEDSNFSHWLEPIEETKVVILRDGNTVTATQYIDGAKVNTVAAKCSPEDSFDFGVGAKLALERLFKSEKPSMSREDVYNKTKEVLSTSRLKFDWDKFSNGEVFVQVSRKTIDDFLRRCEDLNFECVSGKRPTEINLFHDYDAADEIAKLFFRTFELNPGENIWFKTVGKKLALTTKTPESEKAVFKW